MPAAAEQVDDYKTVVIDESSMLTEEQLASVLAAVKGVERLVLVGDDRQLPPIGAGRPFHDIVSHLRPSRAKTQCQTFSTASKPPSPTAIGNHL